MFKVYIGGNKVSSCCPYFLLQPAALCITPKAVQNLTLCSINDLDVFMFHTSLCSQVCCVKATHLLSTVQISAVLIWVNWKLQLRSVQLGPGDFLTNCRVWLNVGNSIKVMARFGFQWVLTPLEFLWISLKYWKNIKNSLFFPLFFWRVKLI